MAVILETSLGDLTIDLYTESCPNACKNFLKLCKIKYYNNCLFHNIQKNFIIQTGDPTNTGKGGESVYGLLYGDQAKYFEDEIRPHLKHTKIGAVSMASAGKNLNGSQFFITVADALHQLDERHTVFGQVSEGLEALQKINDVYTDEEGRPKQVIRIRHTIVLDDPFPDPQGLEALIPDRSPIPPKDKWGDLLDEEEIEKLGQKDDRPAEVIEEELKAKETRSREESLEILGDIPDADLKPPENVLFVCKLNPVTTEGDLEVIFSRFGEIKKCEVIRDWKTNDSLCYAFIEFADKDACEQAFKKMDNVLIDDKRIHVDYSQSLSKQAVDGYGKLVNTWGFWKRTARAAIAKAQLEGKSIGDLKLKEINRRPGDNYQMVFADDEGKKSNKRKPDQNDNRDHKKRDVRDRSNERDNKDRSKERDHKDSSSHRDDHNYKERDLKDHRESDRHKRDDRDRPRSDKEGKK